MKRGWEIIEVWEELKFREEVVRDDIEGECFRIFWNIGFKMFMLKLLVFSFEFF